MSEHVVECENRIKIQWKLDCTVSDGCTVERNHLISRWFPVKTLQSAGYFVGNIFTLQTPRKIWHNRSKELRRIGFSCGETNNNGKTTKQMINPCYLQISVQLSQKWNAGREYELVDNENDNVKTKRDKRTSHLFSTWSHIAWWKTVCFASEARGRASVYGT